MKGLDILGGIGAGIMQGQEAVARNKAYAQKLKEGELQMDAQRQTMEFQRQSKEREDQEYLRQEQERTREEEINKTYQSIYSRDDLDDYGKHRAFATEALPFMTPQQHQQITQAGDALYQTFGSHAIARAGIGDFAPLQRVVDQKMPGAKVKGNGKTVMFHLADGRVQKMDMHGTAQLLALGDTLREQQAEKENRLRAREAEARIGHTRASAGLELARAKDLRLKTQLTLEQNTPASPIVGQPKRSNPNPKMEHPVLEELKNID